MCVNLVVEMKKTKVLLSLFDCVCVSSVHFCALKHSQSRYVARRAAELKKSDEGRGLQSQQQLSYKINGLNQFEFR